MKFTALIVVIEDKKEEEAIKVAKASGAGSVTIIHGRTMGLKEKKIFFGLSLEENVSLLLFVLPIRVSLQVVRSIRDTFDLDNPESNGMVFTMPLTHVIGLDMDEVHKFEDNIRNLI